ncbi:hypothetical protein [Bradyrhizobium centrolobii]|nr:hypothetical protein [Bradyrhizobium centrolobii]
MTCKVEVAGASDMQVPMINVEAIDRPTVLPLRPERFRLSPTLGTLPAVLCAPVAQVIYLADGTRNRVVVSGRDDW